jgi:2-keto-4-pentenoate hydratase/2-oxohepta-3-ene-1,7-dioic acid hydratase in catechol pathway
MKIICIGRNYSEHIKEMKAEARGNPVFFMKAENALVREGDPFFYPDFSKEIHHEVEIVLKINRNGKNIERQFADKYYDEITVGIDFTARDLQSECKKNGLPWEMAKSFDWSAPVGRFIPKSDFVNINTIPFHLDINGTTVQEGNTRDLLFKFDTVIEYVSKFVSLKMGDLIFTGTPAGVGPISVGDKLEGYIGIEKLLEINVK